jgi:hypothetical protein
MNDTRSSSRPTSRRVADGLSTAENRNFTGSDEAGRLREGGIFALPRDFFTCIVRPVLRKRSDGTTLH